MRAIETTRELRLPGRNAIIAGDWHESTDWAVAAIHTAGARSRTILHLGDFGLFADGGYLDAVDNAATAAGIDRILVTPGNHEDWGTLTQLFAAHPGRAIRVSQVVWALPRGYTFQAGSRRFMSFGGAASTDALTRTPGVDWWPEEIPTDVEVRHAIEAGWVDVMLTHDAVNGSGVRAVDDTARGTRRLSTVIESNIHAARARVTRVYRAVGPTLLFHGHVHVSANGAQPNGRRFFSLGCDSDVLGNLVELDFGTLTVSALPVIQATHATDALGLILHPETLAARV